MWRIRNDRERLELDVREVRSLPRLAREEPIEMHQLTDEPCDVSLWADTDSEGSAGRYRGSVR